MTNDQLIARTRHFRDYWLSRGDRGSVMVGILTQCLDMAEERRQQEELKRPERKCGDCMYFCDYGVCDEHGRLRGGCTCPLPMCVPPMRCYKECFEVKADEKSHCAMWKDTTDCY